MGQTKFAVLVYIIRDGKVLMIYGAQPYAPHYQLYNGLGGKIELGETHWQAAAREVMQEASIIVAGFDYVGTIRFLGRRKPKSDWSVRTYRAYDFVGTPTPNDREGHLKWFPIDQVSLIPTSTGDQAFLPYIFAGRHFDAVVKYEGVRLISCEPTFRD